MSRLTLFLWRFQGLLPPARRPLYRSMDMPLWCDEASVLSLGWHERYRQLVPRLLSLLIMKKERGDFDLSDTDYDANNSVVDINVVSAFLILVMASVFLFVLYYFMSQWFLILLVILFCIGGSEIRCPSLYMLLIFFYLVSKSD
uniref:Uncharacterized protein n=1 Tax=Physcomitrium patens TaxID=3218 RepID=A0A2K1K1J6_PHYPA|nr:signal peptide peptidase-like 4 isoform X1 [Physcomitrium patens]PNR47637.1 hypothetical protein PHYPA_012110 [Physcomitrium patens]|eukprot:XP_024383686.1 signal peptide peptidase-like 4 isoform X1 [Physcomitrella patens]